jgi:chemotaxis protein MotB
MKLLSLLIPGTLLFIASCVPARQYQDAVAARDACFADTAALKSQLRLKNAEIQELNETVNDMLAQISLMRKDSIDVHNRYDAMVKANQELREIEATLNNRINQLLALSSSENQQLREDLQKKQDELSAREKELAAKSAMLDEQQKNIEQLSKDLAEREQRVKELQDILNRQEQLVSELKATIDKALAGFSSSDLTVERKNGKVYVSLSEKLLFATGSTVVDPKGKDALKKLADVLKANPDIKIEIEGHTDNVPLKSANFPKDNWDLSVLRATAIVKILTAENGLDPVRLTAEGRGEYFPVADNSTTEGKAKNRRTEIILSPNLDELFNLINKN